MGDKMTFEQFGDPEYRRKLQKTIKSEAVWAIFMELKGLINTAALARQYFERTPGWLSQKINGCTVYDKKKKFSETEYHQLAEAFRDIARRLEAHADEIDAAALETDD